MKKYITDRTIRTRGLARKTGKKDVQYLERVNMNINMKRVFLLTILTIAFLFITSCSFIEVGVVTPTTVSEPISEEPVELPTQTTVVQEISQSETETPEPLPEPTESSGIEAVAWLGHIVSMPAGSQYDDFVILSPGGRGEFGLTGATPEIEAEIRSLRDAEGPEEYIHLWGELTCEGQDYNGCQLIVDKLHYGANFSEETIDGWEGTIISSTFNGATSYVFVLDGEIPMWYSIHASQDEALQAEIESIRDTGAIIRVTGNLLVGIPDVNGTRIEAAIIDVIEVGTKVQPELAETNPIIEGWQEYTNSRYGYKFRYPSDAELSFFGPASFSTDELPEGMTTDEYLEQLQKMYTNQLCVKVETSLGWLYFAAPPNKGKTYTPCGPTGVGSGEIISLTENVSVGDQLYQANGHEIRIILENQGTPVTGETLDMHYEMFMIELEDGTVIRYGAQPRQDATYEDYLMKGKNTLLEIIKTFQLLP